MLHRLRHLFLSAPLLPTLAVAQQNPPIYADGIVNVNGTSAITTTLVNSRNPPSDLVTYAQGAIGAWTVVLPTNPYDGQNVTIGCPGGNVTTLTVQSAFTISPGGPTSCTAASGVSITYQWSFNANAWVFRDSTASGGSSGGSSAGTIVVTQANVGMAPGGQDNAPLIPALMSAISPVSNNAGGYTVLFPGIPGQAFTTYVFNQPLVLSRNAHYICSGAPGASGTIGSVQLAFPAGVTGVIQADASTTSDGGQGGGTISNCSIITNDVGGGNAVQGTNQITGVFNLTEPSGVLPAQSWHVNDGIILVPGNAGNYTPAAVPAVATGAYIGNVSGTTLTLGGSYTVNSALGGGSTPQGMRWYQLPATQAYSVTTTNSSHTVVFTAGPRSIHPGDIIWSDAFPFPTIVLTVTGTYPNQTATMTSNATATHTSGSGTLWVVPAGMKREVTAYSDKNTLTYWPFGLSMQCSTAMPLNCTTSSDSNNYYNFNFIGRYVTGDNTGASTSYTDEFARSTIADIIEAGSVGSSYFGVNSNGGGSTSLYSILGNCGNQNYTVFFGGYIEATPSNYCVGAALESGWAAPTTGSSALFLGMTGATPLSVAGFNVGSALNGVGSLSASGPWQWKDGTACTTLAVGTNGVLNWGGCGTVDSWALGWNSTTNSWDVNSHATNGVVRYFDNGSYSGYTGYAANGSGIDFPNGILLYQGESPGSSPEFSRMLEFNQVNSPASWHLWGDIRFTSIPSVGGTVGTQDVVSFVTTLGANVVKGTTTSVAVAACPSTALPAGISIIDTSVTPYVTLGTLSTCTSTTLTFQAVASNNGTSGDTIRFLQWYPFGPISNTTVTSTPDYTMQTVRSGISGNSDLTGRITLSGGTGSYSLTQKYASAPNCITADVTTPANASSVSESTSTLTFTGTGTDILKYTCAGRN